ncbi:hypothetical protein PQX77_018117 [Marasmius sp. AFHP31]|nr:hypothetical protein PQX77_018117 [Marasmius sp. AFHP31]
MNEIPAAVRSSVQNDDVELAFPLGRNGAIEMVKLSEKSYIELKNLCRDCKLPQKGTKDEMKTRLSVFSTDRDSWNLYQPGAHRSHKGSRSVSAASKGSHKRRAKIIKEVNPGEVERSKDTRSQMEKQNTLAWARKYITENPPRPRTPPQSRPPKSETVDNKHLSAQLTTITEQLKYMACAHVDHGVPTPSIEPPTSSSVVSSSMSFSSPCFPPTLVGASTLSVALQTSSSLPRSAPQQITPSPALSQEPVVPLQPSAVMTDNIPEPAQQPERPTYLTLQDGTRLEFFQSQVPDPGLISFAADIDRLGRTWTECYSGFREDECHLKINGRGIALERWPAVFKLSTKTPGGGTDKRWEGLKKLWNKWRWIGVRYTKSTPDDFWDEFSAEGKRMNFTTIDRVLRKQRNTVVQA